MPTYKHFLPGSLGPRTRTLIKYAHITDKSCICNTDDDNKVKKDATDNNAWNVSNMQRISNMIQTNGNKGTVQFGTQYLGHQPIVNYLGYVQGQPGGSKRPPRNFP